MELSIAEQLVHSTTRITCLNKDDEESTGTAFFFGFPTNDEKLTIPVLVTNKHVTEGATRGWFHVTQADANGDPIVGKFNRCEFDDFQSHWMPHPDDSVDLCVLPVGGLLTAYAQAGCPFFTRNFPKDAVPSAEQLEELDSIEDVIMIGYPIGIMDEFNNMPVCRRGITATDPRLNYQGRTEFLIDAACFPGSSGSPVVLYDKGLYLDRGKNSWIPGTRMLLLGVLWGGPEHTVHGEIKAVPIPTQQQAMPVSEARIPINLGFVIKAERILDFEPLMLQLAKDLQSSVEP